MGFFDELGLAFKIERGNRVFPESDHSSDVIGALQREMKKLSVEVHLNTEVVQVCHKDGRFTGLRVKDTVTGSKRMVQGNALIIATGGNSYQSTGSTGDGYRFAKELGHEVTPILPALVPFIVKEEWERELQGLSLKNVAVTISDPDTGKKIYSDFGEMLFTHFGVSGPLVLSASSYYSAQLAKWTKKNEKKKLSRPECRIELNLKPALTAEQLDKRLLREFDSQKNKNFGNAIDGLFPARLIPVMLELSGIEPEKKVHEITKQERQKFAALIRKLPMTVEKTGEFAEAIITRGGVYVKDVNPSTMESKRLPGLYFAGEVLDVDALTGGFNLQVAWSTGYLAGTSAAGSNKGE